MKARAILDALHAPFDKSITHEFCGVIVEDTLDISRLNIGNVDFSGAVFKGLMKAKATQFLGLAWFKDARFEGGLHIEQALFHSDLRLDRARIEGDFSAEKAEFRGVLDLDYAFVQGKGDFHKVTAYGNVSMRETVFSRPVYFNYAQFYGGFWCDGACFQDDVRFQGAEVHGRTLVRGSQFLGRHSSLEPLVSYGLRQIVV